MSKRETVGLLMLSLGVALIAVDMSIVNLVMPQMARDLELGFTALQYVSALFSLAAAAVVIPAGDIADRIGPRRAYIAGLGVFLAGSAIAAVAPTDVVLLAGRVIQGLGAGAALTAALGTINAAFAGPARGIAFALYGATFAAACAAGPLLGAVIAEASSWRWASESTWSPDRSRSPASSSSSRTSPRGRMRALPTSPAPCWPAPVLPPSRSRSSRARPPVGSCRRSCSRRSRSFSA